MRADCQIPVVFRPLLVSGMLAVQEVWPMILIDSEQSREEQAKAIFHEVLHLLGVVDEEGAERMAVKLAAACPELPSLLDIAQPASLSGDVEHS